jgi:PncC family amidohydrolase
MDLFDTGILKAIKEYFSARRETIAVAESVTSGLVQAAFSSAPGAEEFYQGGITTYNLQQKTRHLHVDPINAVACNCVSERVAVEMAKNVCTLFSSDWGMGITGYATPVPESNNRLYAYYCFAKNGLVHRSGLLLPNGPKDPAGVQLWYVNTLLNLFSESLQ